MTIQDVVNSFNTTPFLFAGSGITLRYYGLPNWKGLLTHFAQKVKGGDNFAFRSYESLVPSDALPEDRFPIVASYIETDYNRAWFNDVEGIRSGLDHVSEEVAAGASPFKAELAAYLYSLSSVKEEYREEIKRLQEISVKNLSGIITTNYDRFFEDTFDGYKTFVGQDALVFSQLQGVAEIYKIHGSVDTPSSIVINQKDYQLFREKSKYIAAKLMTIFMEYPIIFIGYSISDSNIQTILADVVNCLPADKIAILKKRFIFVDYQPNIIGTDISSHSITIQGKVIEMTKISLANFELLYDALSLKKATFPVKVLRRFKDELYSYVLSKEPGPLLRVASIDDNRIDEDMLALTIGLAQTGRFGLKQAVSAEKWYRNILLHDLPYSPEDLLELVYTDLAKQNSWKLPVWYYIQESSRECPPALSKAPAKYSDIVTEKSIKQNKASIRGRKPLTIWNDEKKDQKKAIRLLGFISENDADCNQFEVILKEIFAENPNILDTLDGLDRSNLKKIIRIYDFLKYRKKETP